MKNSKSGIFNRDLGKYKSSEYNFKTNLFSQVNDNEETKEKISDLENNISSLSYYEKLKGLYEEKDKYKKSIIESLSKQGGDSRFNDQHSLLNILKSTIPNIKDDDSFLIDYIRFYFEKEMNDQDLDALILSLIYIYTK